MTARLAFIAVLIVSLAACSKGDNKPDKGGEADKSDKKADKSDKKADESDKAPSPTDGKKVAPSSGSTATGGAENSTYPDNEKEDLARAKAMRENEQLQAEIDELTELIDEAQAQFAQAVESQDAEAQKAAQAKLERLRKMRKVKKDRYSDNKKHPPKDRDRIKINSSTPLGDLKHNK